MGDTDVVSVGGGSHSGRSMRHAGTVMSMAATDLIARGKQIAAALFNCEADGVEFSDGRWVIPGANRTYDMLEFAREIAQRQLPDALKDGLSVATDNEMHEPVFPNGTQVCEVEVDPDTGRVDEASWSTVHLWRLSRGMTGAAAHWSALFRHHRLGRRVASGVG